MPKWLRPPENDLREFEIVLIGMSKSFFVLVVEIGMSKSDWIKSTSSCL